MPDRPRYWFTVNTNGPRYLRPASPAGWLVIGGCIALAFIGLTFVPGAAGALVVAAAAVTVVVAAMLKGDPEVRRFRRKGGAP